jgi:hypothetical protein
MGSLSLIIIFAGVAVLAVLAVPRALRQNPRVPGEKKTKLPPSDPLHPAQRDETAHGRRGESQNPDQQKTGVPQREMADAEEGTPPVPSPPERHPEAATADGDEAGELAVAAGSAEEHGAALPDTDSPIGEDISRDAAGGEGALATADQPSEPESHEAEEAARLDARIAGAPTDREADPSGEDNPADSAAEENEAETSQTAPEACPGAAEHSAPGRKRRYSRRPAMHRDRRGVRRAPPPSPAAGQNPSARTDLPPASASLRLALHAIRRTVSLSLVLSRPEGFPERITLLVDGRVEVGAYDESRYDDIDVAWTSDLLAGELRINSADGLRWVRGARHVHIFAADPGEPDLVSVSAVRAGADHALICRAEDLPRVCDIAQLAGSPELVPHDHWQGVPAGWSVLSGYRPAYSTGPIGDAAFRPLDPGNDVHITLSGGLAIRPRVFAEGRPPHIEIRPVPDGATVMIGGQQAVQNARGSWEAPDWETPGQHIVDVVPGPSLSYEIAADPGSGEGWAFWNAHPEMSGGRSAWSGAGICGARLQGPAGEAVIAQESQSTMIALGANRRAVTLERRHDANVSVGLLAEPPAFVYASSGPRRRQGRVIWLGHAGAPAAPAGASRVDSAWVNAVYTAAVRRLPLVGADRPAEVAWRKAVLRARKLRRQRR